MHRIMVHQSGCDTQHRYEMFHRISRCTKLRIGERPECSSFTVSSIDTLPYVSG
jgi:hypothetical protein